MHISRIHLILALLLFIFTYSVHSANIAFTIVKEGRSDYHIIIPSHPTLTEQKAATEFQTCIKKISGANLPIFRGIPIYKSHLVIICGATNAKDLPDKADWVSLEEDGFSLMSDYDNLYLLGGRNKGCIYAVTTFLEKYLGCRKFSPAEEYFPSATTLSIPPVNFSETPFIRFRDINFNNSEYNEWYKLDQHSERWSMYVHTFARLIPPQQYFKDHPEYFSLLPAGRVPDAQLCLSNPDVLKIIIGELRKRMTEKPEVLYWSVSQNDTYSPCGCAECTKLDSLYGGPSGTMIWFVNQVAKTFPDKQISTLAYQYTRSAPKNIKPEKNVNIFLCSIECNRSKSLETDPSSASFVKDVSDWTKLTTNIHLWDYTIQYRSLVSPFPNLRVLQPNIQFFARNGIRSVFEQGLSSMHGDLTELRSCLVARLLWNPNVNADSVIIDFCNSFYGKAGRFILAYLNTMHEGLASSGEGLWIYGLPVPSEKGYFSAANMTRYEQFFDQAEEAVQTEPVYLRRIQKARLPLIYAQLEQAKIYGHGPMGFFSLQSDSTWLPKQELSILLDTFVNRCQREHIMALHEMGNSPAEYYTSTKQYIASSMKKHKAIFKNVDLAIPASMKYNNGDKQALSDGLTGLDDYHLNWLGFEGTDMEATVNLGSDQVVHTLKTNFLQDINSWIFMPVAVEFLTSGDGINFQSKGTIRPKTPADKAGNVTEEFSVNFPDEQARFIRVKATGTKTCPLWHKGAGGKSWIFADEIVVE